MQVELLHLHVHLLLCKELNGNQLELYLLSSDESPSQSSKQKQVQNGDSFAEVHLVGAEIPTAKTQSFHVHIANNFECYKENPCSFLSCHQHLNE